MKKVILEGSRKAPNGIPLHVTDKESPKLNENGGVQSPARVQVQVGRKRIWVPIKKVQVVVES